MLPNISGLSLQHRRCVPCGTPVAFRTREEQLRDYLNAFAHLETLEDQVDAAECDICTAPLGEDPADAIREGRPLPNGQRKWVDFCGHGHYFHRWCIQKHLETSGAGASCPDCRRPMSNALRNLLQTTEIYPRAPATTSPPQQPPTEAELQRLVREALARHEREEQGDSVAAQVMGFGGAAAGAFALLTLLARVRAEWYAQHGEE